MKLRINAIELKICFILFYTNKLHACPVLVNFQDTQQVIERFKSGFVPPEDFPFEDLSAIKCGEQAPIQTNGHANTIRADSNHSLTYKGTLTSGKLKKRSGIFGIFGTNKVQTEITVGSILV
jgi:hypothetical protein